MGDTTSQSSTTSPTQGAAPVEEVRLLHGPRGISGALVALADQTTVRFDCVVKDEAGLLTCVYRTANWRGAPASLTMTLQRRTLELGELRGRRLALDRYEVVSVSELVVAAPGTATTTSAPPAPSPTPPPAAAPAVGPASPPAPAPKPAAVAAAPASAPAPERSEWLYNLVDPGHFATLKTFLDDGADLSPLARSFYQRYGDDYDFLFFLGVHEGSAQFNFVRHPKAEGLGFLMAEDYGEMFGSPARLKGVIGLPLAMGEGWGPPSSLHEVMHNWGVHWKGDLGFIGVHWGFASTNGSLGGFDLRTLKDKSGAPIKDPRALPTGTRTRVQVAPFAPWTSTAQKGYSPIELYLMGLVDRGAIDNEIFVMNEPRRVPEECVADVREVYDVSGFRVVTMDQILAKNPGGPPRPGQTAFRAAWVLVSSAPASQAECQRAERWAKIFGGVEIDRPETPEERERRMRAELAPGFDLSAEGLAVARAPARARYLSFAEATGNRATMDIRLKPR